MSKHKKNRAGIGLSLMSVVVVIGLLTGIAMAYDADSPAFYTINYIVPQDTSFGVTLVGAESSMDFNPANNNSKNVQPDSQVIATNTPWATIGNIGSGTLTFTVNTTAAQPSWVDVSISNNTAMSGNFSLSSTAQSATGWTSIATGDEVRLYANANFTAAAGGTTQRTLEINSAAS